MVRFIGSTRGRWIWVQHIFPWLSQKNLSWRVYLTDLKSSTPLLFLPPSLFGATPQEPLLMLFPFLYLFLLRYVILSKSLALLRAELLLLQKDAEVFSVQSSFFGWCVLCWHCKCVTGLGRFGQVTEFWYIWYGCLYAWDGFALWLNSWLCLESLDMNNSFLVQVVDTPWDDYDKVLTHPEDFPAVLSELQICSNAYFSRHEIIASSIMRLLGILAPNIHVCITMLAS